MKMQKTFLSRAVAVLIICSILPGIIMSGMGVGRNVSIPRWSEQPQGWFGKLGNCEPLNWTHVVSAMALPLGIVFPLSCKPEPYVPTTYTKNVTANFPMLTQGTNILDFSPAYVPPIAGDGFDNGDVMYYVTNNQTSDRIDSSTDFKIDVNKFFSGPITFTQFFEYKNGSQIFSQDVSVVVNLAGTIFQSVSVPNSSIPLCLEKTVTQ